MGSTLLNLSFLLADDVTEKQLIIRKGEIATMRRLTVEEFRNRVELVKKYMELEQSCYNLDQGIVQIQKATGGLRKEFVSKDGYKKKDNTKES